MQPTSLIAHDQHEASGNAATNRRRVLNLVAIYDGYTSRELAREAKSLIGPLMDLQEVRRRLTDLKDANLVHNKGQRHNRITGKLELTWCYGGADGENITDTTNAGVVP